MTTTVLPPPSPAKPKPITVNKRTYSVAASTDTLDVPDQDAAVMTANGWTIAPTGTPNQPSWSNWKLTAVVTPPAVGVTGSLVDITTNGHSYSCPVGSTLTVPLADAEIMSANGWSFVYPWTTGIISTETAAALGAIGATAIVLSSPPPANVAAGYFVLDLTYPDATPSTMLVASVDGTTINLSQPIAANAYAQCTGNPSGTTLHLATNTITSPILPGMFITDSNHSGFLNAVVTEVSAGGGTTTVTFTPEVTHPLVDGDYILWGGVLPGDQITFINGQVRTSAASEEGSTVLFFDQVPQFMSVGIFAVDITTPDAIGSDIQVTAFTKTTVTLGSAISSPGVGTNDVIAFRTSAP